MPTKSQLDKLRRKPTHKRTEEEWTAIYDAETLARAELIKADPDRLANAELWAAVLLETEKEETTAMQKVANG